MDHHPEDTNQVLEAADEMQRDVERLNTVAQRFSKIGSETNVKTVEINQVIQNVITYFRRRLPHLGKKVTLLLEESEPLYVNINVGVMQMECNNVRSREDALVEYYTKHETPHVRFTGARAIKHLPAPPYKASDLFLGEG